MVKKIISGGIAGIDAKIVEVETDISYGLPCMEMVGNLGSEVREAKERVRVALKNAGFVIPPQRITVNLSPADWRKEGTGYDLPIALALLSAMEQIEYRALEQVFIVGELGLNGEIRGVRGILPMAMKVSESGLRKMIVPKDNEKEAMAIAGVKVFGAENLECLLRFLKNENCWDRIEDSTGYVSDAICEATDNDFADIFGQEAAKRALLIAAAGFHNIVLCGPPGCGKTMLSKRVPEILPPMSERECLEVSRIYSVAGLLLGGDKLITKRPFWSPHHSTTPVALAGGGRMAGPGILSKAHKGVLYLDEVVHFSAETLEMLRQPMEERKITVARNFAAYEYPANFMLVVSMNPCPCGFYPDFTRCNCTPEQIRRYRERLSGPIRDRIDLFVDVPQVTMDEIKGKTGKKTGSEEMKKLVLRARCFQQKRYGGDGDVCNALLSVKQMEQYLNPKKEATDVMDKAFERGKLSLRGYHKVWKVARTIADIEESEYIERKHVTEALSYRERKIE